LKINGLGGNNGEFTPLLTTIAVEDFGRLLCRPQ
jgi:hypothetical protein